MHRMILITTGAMLALATASTTLAGDRNEFLPTSGAWHNGANWSEGVIPDLTWDVVIPDGTTCEITGSTAQAKSIEVEAGAALYVIDQQTLQIRTPNTNTYPSLKVDGFMFIGEEEHTNAATLQLEMTSTSGDHIAEITGAGQLEGWPALMITVSGTNAIDRVHVDSNMTVDGSWEVQVNMENDGLVVVIDGQDMLFDDDANPIRRQRDRHVPGRRRQHGLQLHRLRPGRRLYRDRPAGRWRSRDQRLRRCLSKA